MKYMYNVYLLQHLTIGAYFGLVLLKAFEHQAD